jgi:hypothetical protein
MNPKLSAPDALPTPSEPYFSNYADYSRTLRAWLVAYGVGGPVLFMTNEKVSDRIVKSGQAHLIIALFLIAVAVQVVGSFINKWAAWYVYRGHDDDAYQASKKYIRWAWINEQTWIDIGVDLVSMVLFAWGTVLLMQVFAVATPGTPGGH